MVLEVTAFSVSAAPSEKLAPAYVIVLGNSADA
jgi:hypothetical protein